MTIDEFWAQDRTTLSLQLFGILVCLGLVLFVCRWLFSQKGLAQRIASLLQSQPGLRVYTVARILVALAGGVTLLCTVFPGITPFQQNENLELGGIILFLLWPIVAAQIIGFGMSTEKQVIKEPGFAWVLMICVGIVALAIDNATLHLVFDTLY